VNVLQSLILGLIQGLTEFLPVSSSAHLVIAPSFFGWSNPTVFLDVMLHAGTLAAAVVYFRADLINMAKNESRALRGSDGKINTLWLLVLATLPAAFIGVAFKAVFESFFEKPAYAASLLAATGALLVCADMFGRETKKLRDVTTANAVFIGFFQALAILPGISRSGATISAGMYAGLKREAATRFAFLLSIPIIAGTTLYKTVDALGQPGGQAATLVSLPGAVVAAISGYLAIGLMINIVAKRRFTVFAAYCWTLAALYLLFY
jgi:undecaprenyl-diphosphatase